MPGPGLCSGARTGRPLEAALAEPEGVEGPAVDAGEEVDAAEVDAGPMGPFLRSAAWRIWSLVVSF